MIKYRTCFDRIEAIDIVRETEKMVVIPKKGNCIERREAKRSDYQNWHDTFADAKAFLIVQAEKKVKSTQIALERAQSTLNRVRHYDAESSCGERT